MLPLVGTVEVTLVGIVPATLHGDRYLDCTIEAAGGREAVRIPLHAFRRHPQPGDRLRLGVLLGQVDSVEILDAPKG
jgi:hypothetical protein